MKTMHWRFLFFLLLCPAMALGGSARLTAQDSRLLARIADFEKKQKSPSERVWKGFSLVSPPLLLIMEKSKTSVLANLSADFSRLDGNYGFPVYLKAGTGLTKTAFYPDMPLAGTRVNALRITGDAADPDALGVLAENLFLEYEKKFSFGAQPIAVGPDRLDAEALALMYMENAALANAALFPEKRKEYAAQFISLRERRYARFPFLREYEDYFERLHGSAKYVRLRAASGAPAAALAPEPELAADLLETFRTGDSPENFARRRAAFTGAMQCLILDRVNPAWQGAVEQGKPLYDFLKRNLPDRNPAALSSPGYKDMLKLAQERIDTAKDSAQKLLTAFRLEQGSRLFLGFPGKLVPVITRGSRYETSGGVLTDSAFTRYSGQELTLDIRDTVFFEDAAKNTLEVFLGVKPSLKLQLGGENFREPPEFSDFSSIEMTSGKLALLSGCSGSFSYDGKDFRVELKKCRK